MKQLLDTIRALTITAQAVIEQSGNDIFTDAHECRGTIEAFHTSTEALHIATEQGKIAMLRAAVDAKLAFWDALRAIEMLYGNDAGEVNDKAADAIIELVDNLAASTDDTSWIDVEQVHQLDKLFVMYPL